MSNVDAPSRFIDADIVPATSAGNHHFLDNVISGWWRRRGGHCNKTEKYSEHDEIAFHFFSNKEV
jgi:hypothetical protein